MSAWQEFKALWRWWLPPLVILGLLTAAVLVWLGVVDAPIRYQIL